MRRYRREPRRRTDVSYASRRPLSAQTVSVRVMLPTSIRLPTVLPLKAPRQRQRRTRAITVPLGRSRGRFVKRTVRLLLPRRPYAVKPAYMATRSGLLRIYSRRRTSKVLEREYNRRRYRERKHNRTKIYQGQLESVRGDQKGIVGYAARTHSSPEAIAVAATISRSLGYS